MVVVVEGKIKGKARPRLGKNSTYNTGGTVNYENWVKFCYQTQEGIHFYGPVKANIMVYHKVPSSYSKKRVQAIREGKEYPQKTPDVDNIAKIILDALNKIAYDDDRQVVELTVTKKWTEDKERIEFEFIEI